MLSRNELVTALLENVRALRKLASEQKSVSLEADLRLIAGMIENIAVEVKSLL